MSPDVFNQWCEQVPIFQTAEEPATVDAALWVPTQEDIERFVYGKVFQMTSNREFAEDIVKSNRAELEKPDRVWRPAPDKPRRIRAIIPIPKNEPGGDA